MQEYKTAICWKQVQFPPSVAHNALLQGRVRAVQCASIDSRLQVARMVGSERAGGRQDHRYQ